MMDIIQLLKNLYTNKKCGWILELEESNVQPFVIQKWLGMNDHIRVQVRFLDKFIFYLTPKKYLSLAWSVLPKSDKPPWIKYIKKLDTEEEFSFILPKVRKHFKLSDNDFNTNKHFIINAIRDDMINWFSYYGVPKPMWKKYQINFNKIKEFGGKQPTPQKGLAAWGL